MKVLLYGYGYNSEEEELSHDDSDHNTFSPVRDLDGNTSPSTDPTSSMDSTISGQPSPVPIINFRTPWRTRRNSKSRVDESAKNEETTFQHDHNARAGLLTAQVASRPLSKVILQSTLSSLSDFRYDVYIPTPKSSPGLDPDLDLDADVISVHDEPETPIEVAAAVSYAQPRMRPSMICIGNPTPPASMKSARSSLRPHRSSTQPIPLPSPRSSMRPSLTRSHYSSPSLQSRLSLATTATSSSTETERITPSYRKRMSSFSTRSGFPAGEAGAMDMSPPPVPALPHPLKAESTPEPEPEPVTAESKPKSNHMKRPSLMIWRANSLRRSGMNNFMQYVKDGRSPNRESMQSRPSSASPNEVDKAFQAVARTSFMQRKVDDPAPARPKTSSGTNHFSRPSLSYFSNHSVTALPIPPEPEPPMPAVARSQTFEVTRKKSFQTLRSRGSSIGKALRSASASVVPTTHKSSVSISTPRPAAVDLSSFPVPPVSPLHFYPPVPKPPRSPY